MAEVDFKYWKVGPKMVKDEEDRERVKAVIIKHYGKLKDIFTTLASKSAWPNVTQNEFSHFV